jgi:hypothetical protein
MCEINPKLQQLFERFNRRYWQGKLPTYSVIVSDKYVGCRCAKRERKIYVNPSITLRNVRPLLLHEMAHAAVRGNAHGWLWHDEMTRLIRLGAPLKRELALYARGVAQTPATLLTEFYDAGFETDCTWRQVWRRIAYENGFTDKQGHVEDAYTDRFCRKARREWKKARRFRKRDLEWQKAASAYRMAKQQGPPQQES